MPTIGQPILYRLTSTRTLFGLVGSVVSGDTINAIVFGDGNSWGDGESLMLGARPYLSVALGTGVGEYQLDTTSSTASAAAGAAAGSTAGATAGASAGSTAGAAAGSTAGATAGAAAAASAIAALPPDDDSGLTVVAAAGSSVSLALNTARRPSATRPTRVTATGTWTWALTAIGSVAGTITLQSDASNPPTTPRSSQPQSQSLTLGVAVGLAGANSWTLTYDVPAGHYYRLATTGAGTFAITSINETAG